MAVNLATELVKRGLRVGLLDADIFGCVHLFGCLNLDYIILIDSNLKTDLISFGFAQFSLRKSNLF